MFMNGGSSGEMPPRSAVVATRTSPRKNNRKYNAFIVYALYVAGEIIEMVKRAFTLLSGKSPLLKICCPSECGTVGRVSADNIVATEYFMNGFERAGHLVFGVSRHE